MFIASFSFLGKHYYTISHNKKYIKLSHIKKCVDFYVEFIEEEKKCCKQKSKH